MEERDNKTIMCSVLFLDIVEYSKKSVSGQISLKDRFNSYLSAAIRDVPIVDRIILDTGDGAAINFLGDVEDALKTALSLRESLLNEGVTADPPLLVRMGINLGPVRLVRDINGQPNIVGDGINVAQRVMGFADAAQILVSRSYYDAVSRLSPQYAGMFHYQGSRTDKHVREHEVYAIGYPGDQTTQRGRKLSAVADRAEYSILGRAKSVWRFAASNLDALIEHPVNSFQQANLKQRAFYVGIVAVPLALVTVLLTSLMRDEVAPVPPASVGELVGSTHQPGSAVVRVPAGSDAKTFGAVQEQPGSAVAPVSAVADAKAIGAVQEQPSTKPEPKEVAEASKPKNKVKRPEKQARNGTKPKAVSEIKSTKVGTFVSVDCKGAELFIDGTRKGRISSLPLTVRVLPGKHAVIVSHVKGVYSQDVIFDAGKTVQLNPDFCNQ